ncbi:hypothetical protein LCGC14_2146280 [marine sediment metagenome]|uniref:Uncharacterized protein n=1 Tax=marine sediment metagenome TaxID=412755 RepID=A0A0F9DWU7_9ZZZZ
MTHTPGPYTAQGVDIVAQRPDGSDLPLCLATVYKPIHYGDQRDQQAQDDNVRLFAAAPETAAERDRLKAINAELLGALKRLCDQVEAQPEESAVLVPTGAVRRGRAAIDKAEPSSQ